MPLLHKQIVAAMRLSPTRGKTPLAVLAHPLSVLVSMVAGEMAARPLDANVGAVFFTTTTEATERGRPTNSGIQSLGKDILNQLVYMNPELLHQRIADINANEEKYKDSSFKPEPAYLATKKKLIETSKTLDERAATLTPERMKAEYTYSDDFFAFKDQWDAYYDRVVDGDLTSGELAGNEVLKTLDAFYEQYRAFHAKFKDLGYIPSMEPPKKSTVGDTFGPLPTIPEIASGLSSIVKPILYGGLALGAGLVVLSVYRSSSAPSRA